MYQGEDSAARRREIETFDYPDFQVFEVGKDRAWSRKAVPEDVDVCVFWIDDGKPVGKSSIAEMIHTLTKNDPYAMPATVPSLLQLLLPVLDAAEPKPSVRIHMVFLHRAAGSPQH